MLMSVRLRYIVKSCPFTSYLQTPVACNDGSLVVDRYNTDVYGAGQTVLADFCLIGHDGEVVALGVAAVVDVRDVLALHLETNVGWRRLK